MSLDTSPDPTARLIAPMTYAAHYLLSVVALLAIVPAMMILRTCLRSIALALQLSSTIG